MPERLEAFTIGLKRHGYKVVHGLTMDPGSRDICSTWNRVGPGDNAARVFESRGLPVLVAENAAWGNGFMGGHWYSIGRNCHNRIDPDLPVDPGRWDSLGVELQPFRTTGETVILPQRGIGSGPSVMPRDWPQRAHAKYGGRIRPHPGRNKAKPLEDDLANAGLAITWASGAAIKALMMGVPVVSEMPDWIGTQNNTEAGRLEMFRRLAWNQWRLEEIASGEAFECFTIRMDDGRTVVQD